MPGRSQVDQGGWLNRAQRTFPGGVLGTFRLPEGLEIVAEKGLGAFLYAVGGRRYIDYILGSGPLIVGHAHPKVVASIARQAACGSTFYTLNRPTIELAEEILSVFPQGSRLMFTSSGSEATFYAMRLARAFTGRTRILKFAGAYHGHNDYGMLEAFAAKWTPGEPHASSAGIPKEASDTVEVAEFNDRESVTKAFDRFGSELAAVIVEPYQRMLEPDPGFLGFLREITEDHGTLLIADEVVTGFRFHYGMAQTLYGISADLTALGKIIGGGLPVAAVAGRADIMQLADSGKRSDSSYVYVSGTLNGYALGAAAGLATLAILKEPGAYDRLNGMGESLRTALRDLAASHRIPAVVVGRGPMFHILFTDHPTVARTGDIVSADREVGFCFARALLEQDILVQPQQRSYVSLAHTQNELEVTSVAFDRAFSRISTR